MTQATLETPPCQDEGGDASNGANANLNQIVSFQLGDEEFGLDIMRVQEIILVGAITKMPQVPEYVRGMINLRGHVIPVVDLRTRFGQPQCEKTEEQRIIVVNIASKTIGIVVDAVNEVLRVKTDQIEPPPTGIGSDVQRFITGLLKIDQKLIILLDIEGLFSDEERSTLTEAAKAASQ